MMDFTMIDPTIDRTDPDPLKLAEDRVAEADQELTTAIYAAGLTGEELDTFYDDVRSARADLAALRAQLAAEADDELPYREGMG